jgi:hypothetical protein
MIQTGLYKLFPDKKALPLSVALAMLLAPGILHAQDSLKQQTIDIYSTYQPKLRDAAKLSLTASLPYIDTTRPRLIYNIPAQNLNFTYQPLALRPLAMGKDTLPELQNNFVKAGFGNYSTPFLQVGLGGGRDTLYNYSLFLNHLSSQGNIANQDFSDDNLGLRGQYFTNKLSFDGKLSASRNSVYYYGYDHDTLHYSKSDVRQVFTSIAADVSMQNIKETNIGLDFHPRVHLSDFFDYYGHHESTFYIEAPFTERIADGISISADFIGDYSTYADNTASFAFSNVISTIHPALNIVKPGFILHAGVNPSWNNGQFFLLPDIVNETDLIKSKLVLSSGWISYFQKNDFEYLSNENPFFTGYNSNFMNTRIEEKYSGIKGTLSKHFNYNTKFSYVTYTDMPLFVNDSLDGKTFYTVYEDKLQAYQLHGEVNYLSEENFQVGFSMDWFNYFKLQTQPKPWGLVPFQANLYAAVWPFKGFKLTADIFALSGDYFLENNGSYNKTKGAFDANLGASYQISSKFGIWLNVNNLFNSQYQRWHNYPSLGLNALGGVLIKF